MNKLRSSSGEMGNCPTSGQDTANYWPLSAAGESHRAGKGQFDMFRQGGLLRVSTDPPLSVVWTA